MSAALRVFCAGLPLLPLFVRSVPAPWDATSALLRPELDPALATGTPPAAATSTAAATATVSDTSTPKSFLTFPAYPRSTNADPVALSRRSEAVLFFPPDAPPPSHPSPTASMPSAAPPQPPSASPPPSASDEGLNLDAHAPAHDSDEAPSRPLVMGYYPDWAADDFPPEKIDFGRFDWIDFAFAVPDAAFNLTWDGSDDAPDVLQRLVARAHSAGKKVKLSVGGWTGSRYFSAAAVSAEGRTALANNIRVLYTQYGLDGVDLDWEYPAQGGNAGNLVSTDDSANFLAFLRVLRAMLPPGAIITAATQTVPFAGPDGAPMRDVSEFAAMLDWVLLMNYDTWGSSSTPGPNAPLSDACNNSTQGSASAFAALRTWTAAGFPASQLVLGVPSYGYLSRSTASLLRTRATAPHSKLSQNRKRKQHRNRRHSRVLGWIDALVDKTKATLQSPGTLLVLNEDGGSDSGQVQFRELVRQGIIQPYSSAPNASSSSSGTAPPTLLRGKTMKAHAPEAVRVAVESHGARRLFAGGGGFERRWDACSSTPFVRSGAARQVVTYDDPVSLEMKAQLVREAGMRGVNMFDVSGDTDDWDLTDALLRGVGVK